MIESIRTVEHHEDGYNHIRQMKAQIGKTLLVSIRDRKNELREQKDAFVRQSILRCIINGNVTPYNSG